MIPVSICLTTYNRAKVLTPTIDSLLAQSWEDFELIISDDCSSDDTQRICEEYATRDRRVRYFRNRMNLKMPQNLNVAVGHARGHYIANVHDGDVYRKDLIEKWKLALDAHKNAPFVFNAYETIDRVGARTIIEQPFDDVVPGLYIARNHFDSCASCVWGTVMARASAYEQAGRFDPTFGFLSDVDMWLRLAYLSDVAYVREPLITVTPREESHPYRYDSWDLLFWQFRIYVRQLRLWAKRLGPDSGEYVRRYPDLLR